VSLRNPEAGEPPGPEEGAGESPDEGGLVARAKKGDAAAVDEIIRRYHQKAFAIAFRNCSGDVELARDLTQEAFLRVIRNLKRFETKASFYTWLYRIVVNTCLDAKRRERRRRWLIPFSMVSTEDPEHTGKTPKEQAGSEHGDPNPLSALSGKELKVRVQDALATLSEQQRMVFELKVFEERGIPEIAGMMGIAEGTIKSHLFRATRHVRKALAEWHED
jgi:RNA polymerase sigma-70 factor (ECF subfamily)